METPRAHILVVDDEPSVRTTLTYLLQGLGYDVSVACCGEEALSLLEQRRFNLLLLDLSLPGMNGLEVARQAQALQPSAAILLLTGWMGDTLAAQQAVAFEQICKTTSPKDVLARIKARVGSHQGRYA